MNILVILGNKLLNNGEIDTILINRLKMGQHLYNTGNYNLIIVSGGKNQTKAKHTEAYKMKKYLIDNYNIPSKQIITEARSKTTIENSHECLKIIKTLSNVKSLTIVSSKFHIKRVKLIFNHVFNNTKYKKNYISSKNGIIGDILRKRIVNENKYYTKYIKLHQVSH
jgi:uncharacterized SAM-binding protein YcdF (DUF218 family)